MHFFLYTLYKMSFLYDGLLGNFIKFVGVSAMESSSSTMLPIGIAMGAYKIVDSDMLGGQRNIYKTKYNQDIRKISYSKKELCEIYDQIMTTIDNRKKVVSDLLRLLKKHSVLEYNKLYKLLKDMSTNKNIHNKNILKYFSKELLLINLQK